MVLMFLKWGGNVTNSVDYNYENYNFVILSAAKDLRRCGQARQ